MKMVMTSECQQQQQGNMLLLLSVRDKRRRRRKLEWAASSSNFRMEILVLAHLVLLLLYIIPVPSNQVPHRRHQQRQITQQQLRSSADQPAEEPSEVQITPLPLLSPSLPNGAQQQHPDAPKLIPLSALDRYQEGADLRLFCSASAPQSGGRLQFEWRKNQAEQLASSNDGTLQLQQPQQQPNRNQLLAPQAASSNSNKARHLSISMMDDSSSVLRINHLEAEDGGNYTCLARNQHGFDSSTVRVDVNVRLKWIREPPGEIQVRAGKSIQLECDASGQPLPSISWTSLRDHQTIHSKVLRIDRAQVNDSGLYECKANGGHNGPFESVHHAKGEQLRKIVKLIVNVSGVRLLEEATSSSSSGPRAGRLGPRDTSSHEIPVVWLFVWVRFSLG